MHKIFDCNMHVTATGKFKSYKKNMPCTFENYLSHFGKDIEWIGSIHSGLPNLEEYSLNRFETINAPYISEIYTFPAICTEGINRLPEFLESIMRRGHRGCKLHPGLLGIRFSWRTLVNIMKECECYGLDLMLCSYCAYPGSSNVQHIEYLRFLEHIGSTTRGRSSVLVAHGGCSWFFDYYELARVHKNILLDTSFSFAKYSNVLTDKILFAIDENKGCIAFGTDWPDYCIEDYRHIIDIAASDNILNRKVDGFLWKNALSFFS